MRAGVAAAAYARRMLSTTLEEAKMKLRTIWALGACGIVGLDAAAADAQNFPTRPVRLVVAASTGGTPDILARIVAPKLNEQLGQAVIVDNRPGATGNIGAEVVAKAQPDGYTMMIASSVLAISPAFYKKLSFNAATDLAPLTLVASQALFLFVQSSSPIRSLADLVAAAKAKPGQVPYASFGTGSPQHVATELFQIVAGIKLVHVPYKSGGLMTTALLSGEVQTMFLGLSPALPHVKSGRLRTIAMASAKRSPSAPDVPTFAEAGIPGVVVDNWFGMLTTAGAPRAVVERLHAEILKAVQAREVSERIVQQGLDIVTQRPDEYHAFLKSEISKWRKLVAAAGLESL
jgi:tripartite-type tricarboxylate transporter receptor subunit TctC